MSTMHARAIEWRPADGDGWAILAEDQMKAAHFMSIESVSNETELLSPAFRLHLPEGTSFVSHPAGMVALVFGRVQKTDTAVMRTWLDGLFPDIRDDPVSPDDRHPLDAMAAILCDFTDDRWLMLGPEDRAWNLARVRMEVPTFSDGTMALIPMTILVLGTALIVCWHDNAHSAIEVTSRVDAQVRDRKYSGIQGAPVAELASRYVGSCLSTFAPVAAACNRWIDVWEETYIASIANRAQEDTQHAFHDLSRMRRNVVRLQNAVDEIEQGRSHPLADAWWSTHAFSRVVTLAVTEGLQQAASGVDRLRAEVSDAFVMASIAATMEQSRIANETQARFGRLQQAVTWLTAFLLAPGLVATVFGANIALPGHPGTQRTFILLAAMVAFALLTFLLLSRFIDRE